MNLSTLFGSVHFTAFVLGAALYLGYLLLPYLRNILQPISQIGAGMMQRKVDDSSESEPTLCKQSRKFTLRQAAFCGAVLSLLAALFFSTGVAEQVSTSCPSNLEDSLFGFDSMTPTGNAKGNSRISVSEVGAKSNNVQVKPRSPGTRKFTSLSRPSGTSAASPSELLKRAHVAIDLSEGTNEAMELLEECAEWSPAIANVGAPLDLGAELHAQLKCIDRLVDSGFVGFEATPSLLSKSRSIMVELRSRTDVTRMRSIEVEWARITHALFQLRCKAAVEEINVATQKIKAARGGAIASTVGPALAALQSLKRLEAPLSETIEALKFGEQGHEKYSNETSEELQVMRDALGSDRACAVQALQGGRSLALVLPKNAPLVRKMLVCRPRMFEAFEDFVVKSAMQTHDAATRFGLGLYFSDIGLAVGQGQARAPFFGAGPTSRKWSSSEVWLEDAEGLHAPGEIVEAEALLLDGQNSSADSVRSDRAATRALRLYQHAKMLALKHHDGAAEWRYLAAAQLAATHHRQKLAAHALGRLGYFLSLRGRKTEALEMIGEALKHGNDPLAQYLQASLRRSLGELRTTEDITIAETQLSSVAGQLPSKLLEEQRESAHTQITWWRLVGTQGLQVCLKAWDAAQFLICMFCGMLFELPQAAKTEAIAEAAQ